MENAFSTCSEESVLIDMPAFYTWVGSAVNAGYLKKERGEKDSEDVASATEFFFEKIMSGSMKLDGLPLVGY